jgi:aminoglycoside phosphotransferase (APT) family kinase protein
MSMVTTRTHWQSLDELLSELDARALVIGMSRDPNAKLTVLLFPKGAAAPAFAVKLPTTASAAEAVERERRLLVALRHLDGGPAFEAVPAVVGTLDHAGFPALVMGARPGTPMTTVYHRFRHTARPDAVRADFAMVAAWLRGFQDATAAPAAPIDLAAGAAARLRRRFGRVSGGGLLDRLELLNDRLGATATPRTAVHGDLWCGNLLVAGGAISGVVDWEAGAERGEPLRDLVRFALAYALYLDRHTRPGRPVAGHPRLRAGDFGAGIAYALDGGGWFPELFRAFLVDGLGRLGVPTHLWRDVALAGVAEVAAGADHDGFALAHLELLRRLLTPAEARR